LAADGKEISNATKKGSSLCSGLALDVAVYLALVMQIVEPQQQFTANNGDVRLRKRSRFKLLEVRFSWSFAGEEKLGRRTRSRQEPPARYSMTIHRACPLTKLQLNIVSMIKSSRRRVLNTRAVVFGDPFRFALGQVCNLLLDLADVVVLVKWNLETIRRNRKDLLKQTESSRSICLTATGRPVGLWNLPVHCRLQDRMYEKSNVKTDADR
jgi:hypothetical protein